MRRLPISTACAVVPWICFFSLFPATTVRAEMIPGIVVAFASEEQGNITGSQMNSETYLQIPDMVIAHTEVTVNLIGVTEDSVQYFWDRYGSGRTDTITSVPELTIRFPREGEYTIRCTVRNDQDSIQIENVVSVANFPTQADAKGPYRVQVNTPLTVEATVVDKDNRVISYSWDFDNDGRFDWSSSSTSRTSYTFTKAGEYPITFKVVTDDGRITTVTTSVTVENMPPQAIAGKDVIARAGRKITLRGSGKDPDGKIVLYEWDFDGDGRYDWSSPDTGHVEHIYQAYSRSVLRVTDSDGEMDTDTIRVVICPDGMVAVAEGVFCIDEYEWPNQKGIMPAAAIGLEQARAECEKVGKRLCTAQEWERACRGPRRRATTYPYGDAYMVENCNTLGNTWSRNQSARSGEFPRCRSRFGVYDMSGNIAEWTQDGLLYGGWWNTGRDESSCGSRTIADPNQAHFYAGFRCCK